MNLHRLLQARAKADRPIRVGLIGAGKFGTMFLSQALHTPGREGKVITSDDLNLSTGLTQSVAYKVRREMEGAIAEGRGSEPVS